MKHIIKIGLIVLIALSCCKSNKIKADRIEKIVNNKRSYSTAPIIIYKTIKDFSDLVPVTMDVERTKIVSYPSPTDLFYQGKLSKPTIMKNNYLLDNRGINPNVVFLKYSYEVYSQLIDAPTISEMMVNIVEKYPLSEFIYCGNKSSLKDNLNELNNLIENGFPNCKRIK